MDRTCRSEGPRLLRRRRRLRELKATGRCLDQPCLLLRVLEGQAAWDGHALADSGDPAYVFPEDALPVRGPDDPDRGGEAVVGLVDSRSITAFSRKAMLFAIDHFRFVISYW